MKQRKMKRLLLVMVLAALVVCAVPLTAFAAESNNCAGNFLSTLLGQSAGNQTITNFINGNESQSIRSYFENIFTSVQERIQERLSFSFYPKQSLTMPQQDSASQQNDTCVGENCLQTEAEAAYSDGNHANVNTDYAANANTNVQNNNTSADDYAARVTELVNAGRAAVNLPALELDASLSAAATIRAQEIATKFDHERPDGSRPYTVLSEAGISYGYAAENIAAGQKSPGAVVAAWMNSAGHRTNMLATAANKIGVGSYTAPDGTIYWVQLFTD